MPEHADLIVTNARILTMDEGNPRAEAIAIADGDDPRRRRREVDRRAQGAGNQRHRCRRQHGGARLHRGAHASVRRRGRTRRICNCSACHGFDALHERDARLCRRRAPRPRLLQAQGADYTILSADERVTRHHLDRIIADRPFAMSAPDHHTMWANTKALELAGLLQRQDARPGQRDRHGRRRAGGRRIARGRGVRPAARACRRKPRAARPGDRRRARSQADGRRTGA